MRTTRLTYCVSFVAVEIIGVLRATIYSVTDIADCLFVFCQLIYLFILFIYEFQVGHIQKRQLSPGKMYEIKTLSLKPLIFGKTTVTTILVILRRSYFTSILTVLG